MVAAYILVYCFAAEEASASRSGVDVQDGWGGIVGGGAGKGENRERRDEEHGEELHNWRLVSNGDWVWRLGGLRATRYGAGNAGELYIHRGEKTKTRKDLAFSVSYSAVSDSQSQIHSKTATLSKGFDHHHNIDVTLKEREYYNI